MHLTASRIGAPGCRVRLEAADDLDALDWTIDHLDPPRGVTVDLTADDLDDMAEHQRALDWGAHP